MKEKKFVSGKYNPDLTELRAEVETVGQIEWGRQNPLNGGPRQTIMTHNPRPFQVSPRIRQDR